jgi:hypothetical protein
LAERPARLAAIRERVRALELEEEQAIVDGERNGVRIDRRPDADPAVFFASTVLAGAR